MDKKAIRQKLSEAHLGFTQYIHGLGAAEFLFNQPDKWTPGQQLEHILLSVTPLRQVLILPTFMMQLVWGKANRPSRTYDQLVEKYKLKLAQGGRATGRFIPRPVPFEKRTNVINTLHREVDALNKKLDRFTEQDLDTYILPHPLLGKLTLREMLYFTIYHVEHHRQLTIRDLVAEG